MAEEQERPQYGSLGHSGVYGDCVGFLAINDYFHLSVCQEFTQPGVYVPIYSILSSCAVTSDGECGIKGF